MRLLFVTDSQCKAKNPSRRLDQFPLAMLRKYVELSNVIPAAKIDAVVHGGDMFDLPRVSPEYCGRLAEIIRFTDVPWYVVPGNHDIYGYTTNTIDQTMLGLLAKTNVVNLLTRNSPVVLTDYAQGFSVSLQGQEYYAEIDKGNPEDYDVKLDSSCKYHVLAAHGMLLDKPFHTAVAQTLITDVHSKADLILAGHYHPGYAPIKQDKTVVINPGAMARVEAGKGDDRLPQFVIIEFTLDEMKFKLFPFQSAKPSIDILDFAGKKEEKMQDAMLAEFKKTLQQSNVFSQTIDIPTALSMVAADPNNNITGGLVSDALNAIALVQQSADDAIPKLDGFVESVDRVYITRVEGEDFQSHHRLDIEFTDGLNIIRGESNSGKTAILRLIKWVLFNEPKGADMISNWANSCTGRVHLSNGYIVERGRTKKSGGYYLLTDPHGNQQKFEGFGNDIPPEIINAHQMPPVFITKDEKRNIAMATQLESSFLVTESASFRAAAIGRLTGVQHVDATMRALNAENRNLSKEIGVKEKLIKADQQKLTAFDTLPQEQTIINQFQLELAGVKMLIDEVKELTDTRNTILYLDSQLSSIDGSLAQYDNLPTQAEIEEAEKLAILSDALERIRSTVTKVDSELAVVDKRQKEIEPLLQSELDIVLAEDCLRLIDSLRSIKNKVETIDIDLANTQTKLDKANAFLSTEQYMKDAEDALTELQYLTGMKQKIADINHALLSNGMEMDFVDERITQIEHDMGECLGGEHCECPTCGTVVSKEKLLGGAVHE